MKLTLETMNMLETIGRIGQNLGQKWVTPKKGGLTK